MNFPKFHKASQNSHKSLICANLSSHLFNYKLLLKFVTIEHRFRESSGIWKLTNGVCLIGGGRLQQEELARRVGKLGQVRSTSNLFHFIVFRSGPDKALPLSLRFFLEDFVFDFDFTFLNFSF